MPRIDAAVMPEVGELRFQELTLDEPRADEVLVDLRATGICHTDYHFYLGDYEVPKPVVLGHEGAGVVEAVGPGVNTVSPGDHVVLSLLPTCNTCRFCRQGRPYLCQSALDVRFEGTLLDGTRRLHADDEPVNHFYAQSSFATKAVVPVESVVPVPSGLPFDIASMLGCGTLTGIGAVLSTATLHPGDAIAVFGCGGTGASAVLGAATISLGPVIAVDVVPEKLRIVEGMGATHTVDATESNPVDVVHDITAGGVQYAFDFVGFNDEVRNQAIEATEPGGTVVLSGGAADDAQLNVSSILAEGRTITSNVAGSARPHLDIPRYADLYLDGDLPLDQILTRTYDLVELENAFAALAAGKVVKSAISFR